MRRFLSFTAVPMVAVLFCAVCFAQDTQDVQNAEPVKNQPADPGDYQTSLDGNMDYGTSEYAGDYCGAGCGDGCDVGCGGYDVCNPCAGVCDGVYNGCGYGYGCGFCIGNGCCAGLFGLVGGAVQLALTPVHWVAGLLSCGTYGDCGCAPLPYRVYRDPCDNCGNWIGGGDCSGCGGCSTCGGPNGIGGGYVCASETMNFGNDSISNYGKSNGMGRRSSAQMIAGDEVYMDTQPRRVYRATQEPIMIGQARRAQVAEVTTASAPTMAPAAPAVPRSNRASQVRARRVSQMAARPTIISTESRRY